MEGKKFILCQTDVARVGNNQWGNIDNIGFNFGLDSALEGSDYTFAIDLAISDLSIQTDEISNGIDNVVVNSSFDNGNNAWAESLGSNAGASFGPDDFSFSFESYFDNNLNDTVYWLRMRTYQNATGAPFISQSVVIPNEQTFKCALTWTRAWGEGTNTGHGDTNYHPWGIGIPEADLPAVSLGGIVKRFPRAVQPGFGEAIKPVEVEFTLAELQAVGFQAGDSAELKLQMRDDVSGTNTNGYEYGFTDIELGGEKLPTQAFYITNTYESTDCFLVFENVTQEQGMEDFQKVLDASSGVGAVASQDVSFVRVEDLDLHSDHVWGHSTRI